MFCQVTRNNQLTVILHDLSEILLRNVPFSYYSATDRHQVTTTERAYLVVLLNVAEVDCHCFVLMLELGERRRAKQCIGIGSNIEVECRWENLHNYLFMRCVFFALSAKARFTKLR